MRSIASVIVVAMARTVAVVLVTTVSTIGWAVTLRSIASVIVIASARTGALLAISRVIHRVILLTAGFALGNVASRTFRIGFDGCRFVNRICFLNALGSILSNFLRFSRLTTIGSLGESISVSAVSRCNRASLRNWQFHLHQPLNLSHTFGLLWENDCDGTSFCPGSPRAPNSMDIIFRTFRNVKVDHHRNFLHVDPSAGDIGGNKYSVLARFESSKSLSALG